MEKSSLTWVKEYSQAYWEERCRDMMQGMIKGGGILIEKGSWNDSKELYYSQVN